MTFGRDASRGSSETWSWTLPFVLPSVRDGRRRVRGVLRSEDVRADVVDDACSVVSELLANALRHARPRPDGHLLVTIAVDDASVVLAVADGGGATIPTVVSPTQLSPSGRGLGIVDSLTREWGVEEGADGNTVFGILSRA